MSVGRVSTFLDIYIQRDLDNGTLTETEAQELIDHMVMKFRMVKFARIPSYNQLFSGDPVWATLRGRRHRHGWPLHGHEERLPLPAHPREHGPAPEPNMTVLYSSALPKTFKDYASKISIDTSSVQYENDDVMKPVWAMTTPSAAAFLPPRPARRCSSSVPARTLPSACCTPSTAASMRNSASRSAPLTRPSPPSTRLQ